MSNKIVPGKSIVIEYIGKVDRGQATKAGEFDPADAVRIRVTMEDGRTEIRDIDANRFVYSGEFGMGDVADRRKIYDEMAWAPTAAGSSPAANTPGRFTAAILSSAKVR